ncbi:hypothetical protein Acsp04_38600 [Actinomadura sp. NBRC 104425]|uniref:hypothetical protein n=1 Tax=Actinomadura sp. NBRC 104425 TaxID=3032204 RepID=UPI0024A04F4B|nr:hypothetical protein [Actinomadura sp. NBRC 104425]GLZ13625.1 hypothetical protein Acsp04_38600 [Actinomadura sp. NBRC 104425]
MEQVTWKLVWPSVFVFPALILTLVSVQDSPVLLAVVACTVLAAVGAVARRAATLAGGEQADAARLDELEPFPAGDVRRERP